MNLRVKLMNSLFKNTILLFSLFVFTLGSKAQINMLFPFTDLNWAHYKLKGQVKEMKQTQYLAPNLSQEIVADYLLNSDTFYFNLEFDTLGQTTQIHRLSNSFDLVESYNYTQSVLECFSWAKSYLNCYVYNDKGQIIEDVGYFISENSNRKRRRSTKYEYSDSGKLIGSVKTDSEDRILASEHWHYNTNGDLNEKWVYTYQFEDSSAVPFDTIWHHYKVQYKKNLVHLITFESNSEFNDQGKYTFRHKKSNVIFERYQEYEKGKCVQDDQYFLNDGRIYKWSSLFGEPLKLIAYSYVYEFDETGNWIKRIASVSGVEVSIVTRDFVYY